MNAIIAFCVSFFLSYFSIAAYRHGRDLNTRKCKLTHSGIEYQGNIFTSKFKSLCRPWNSIGTESDLDFVDGSRILAKNFCRNPNGTRENPWCYTYNPDNPVESCAVPLCNSKRCRATGPGAEYGGDANATKSGHACSRWTDVAEATADAEFPDGSRAAAGNRCRNPTGDPGGPWCYASADGAAVERDYCDTPGCDDGGDCDWTLVSGGGGGGESWSAHGHYSAIVTDDGQTSFELKAWDPAAAVGRGNKPFRMSLTAYPFAGGPSGGDGFEVRVPAGSFAHAAARPVRMDLTWRNGLVVLSRAAGRAREVLSFELNATLLPATYVSFAVGGHGDSGTTPVAVRFPECDPQTAGREEHVTNNQYAYRIFPLRKTITSNSELSFSVRAVISASVTYYTAPAKQTPCLIIVFSAQPEQQVKVMYKENSTSEEQLIFHQSYKMDVLSYWKWHQYTITIMDKTLQVEITNERQKEPIVILNITDNKFKFFHWFSIGSKSIAHWTLYCSGSEYYPLPKAVLPECVVSKSGVGYRGTQWIDGEGNPCVPWNVSSVRNSVKESALIDGSYVKAKNYCRNPTKDPEGPYCFVAIGGHHNAWDMVLFGKRSCHVQKCQNTKCGVVGMATDYVGTLNKTVSNRTCLKWSAVKKSGVESHVFPDGSSSSSTNYCRNPTKEPTGAWCYVNGAAGTDLCDVPECSDGGGGGDYGTLLTGGGGDGGVHWLYVLPEWRNSPPGLRVALKRWAAGGVHRGTVSLRFRRDGHRPQYDVLRLSAEKIVLFRALADHVDNGSAAAVRELVYPHLLLASRWTELLFEFADAAIVMSTVVDGEILRWPDHHGAGGGGGGGGGRVAFVGLSADGDEYAGARFPSEECLVHSSESTDFTVFLPINVRTNTSLTAAKNEIVFRLKYTGVTRIALIRRNLSEPYVLEIDGKQTTLSREGKPWMGGSGTALDDEGAQSNMSKTGDFVDSASDTWTRIYLSWNESVLTAVGGGVGRRWTVEDGWPLWLRYFSVANRGGKTVWTVNCNERWRPPPDVDGPPRDGGWSEWDEWERCTRPCGGGTGVRGRRCDSPRPNLSGRPCAGPATAVGKCNEHECGQVSGRTAAAVRRLLAGRAHNARLAAGDRLSVSCDASTVDAVKTDSPRARFEWLRNGKSLSTATADDQCTLIINSCTTSDSGVYAFVAQPQESEKIVLKIVAVSVYEKPMSVYIKDKVQVRCNAVTLSYLFSGLTQAWIVNDSYVIKNYGTNSLAAIDADQITIENIHYQGVWKCVVKSDEINSTWVTSIMEVKVIGISTTWTRMMQDPIIKVIFRNSRPTTIVLICTIIILSLCICTWSTACVLNRWRGQLSEKGSKPRYEKINYHRLQ